MTQSFKITILGIGGAGCLSALGFPELESHRHSTVLIDTQEALERRPIDHTTHGDTCCITIELPINESLKSDVSMAKSFTSIKGRLMDALSNTESVLLFAGLGGKTGGSLAPIIAKTAAGLNVPVIAQVYLPWASEGAQAKARAHKSLTRLLPHCVYSSIINNEPLGAAVPGDASLSRLLSATAGLQAWHAIDVLRLIRMF